MDWLFPWNTPDLARWEARPIHPESRGPAPPGAFHDRHERIVAVEAAGPPERGGPFERVLEAILGYDIFPADIGEGVVRRRPVQLGDTVGLTYRFVPGLRCFFASRVTAVDGQGFTYQTLCGHAEIGEERFRVEKDERTGEVRASLSAWSRPGLWYVRLVTPLARRLQLAAGRRALDHLQQVALTRPEAWRASGR